MEKDIFDFIQERVSEVRLGKDWVTVCIRRASNSEECFRFIHTTFSEAVLRIMREEKLKDLAE